MRLQLSRFSLLDRVQLLVPSLSRKLIGKKPAIGIIEPN
jgi:hypothetical protein